MTQVALRAESEFAAGVACRACRVTGNHFCQAHDYDDKDEPACKTCLTGELCGPMKARQRQPELDGPPLAPAPAPVDLRHMCVHGCGKKRHRGVCAPRRAALIAKGTNFAAFGQGAADIPIPTQKAAVREVDPPPETPRERQEVLQEILKSPNEAPIRKALELPVFEVVARGEVQWRRGRTDRYADLVEQLKRLGPGQLLKVSFPSEAAATSYAKNFSWRLRKYNLRVRYQRHGEVIFVEVKPPLPPIQ